MYNYICEKCGSYLDPGEKCDCEQQSRKKTELMEKNIAEEFCTRQYRLVFQEETSGK